MSTTLQVTLTQTNTVEPGVTVEAPIYRVKSVIETSENITLSLFVFKLGATLALDTFSHIAMPNDLQVYLEDRAQAVSAGHAFYRQRSITLDFTTAAAAADYALVVRQRVSSLLTAQPIVAASFTGATTYTLTEATT